MRRTLAERSKSERLMHKTVMLRAHTRRAQLGRAQKQNGLMRQSNIKCIFGKNASDEGFKKEDISRRKRPKESICSLVSYVEANSKEPDFPKNTRSES